MAENSRFRPNVSIPLKNFALWGVFVILVLWAFFGFSLLSIFLFLIYLILGFIYLMFKLTVQFEVGDDFIIKRNILFKWTKAKRIDYSSISHFDIEKGVIIKLKSGEIFTMDNSQAVGILSEKLTSFGIAKKIVNRHENRYK